MTNKSRTMLLSPDSEKASLRIEVFVLCEAAQEFDGRLNLLGTFETVQVPDVPLVLPGLSAAIRMRFWPEEAGWHQCILRIIGNDGGFVAQDVETEFVTSGAEQNGCQTVNLIVRFQNIAFHDAGEYSLELYLDENLEASLPLRVTVGRRIP